MSARLVTLEGDCYSGLSQDAIDFSEIMGIDPEDFELLSGGPESLDFKTDAYLRDKYMGFIPIVAAVGAANALSKTGMGKKIGGLFKKISFRRKKKKKNAPAIVPSVVTQVGVPTGTSSATSLPTTITTPTAASVVPQKLVQVTRVPTAYLIGGAALLALFLLRRQ